MVEAEGESCVTFSAPVEELKNLSCDECSLTTAFFVFCRASL